MKRIAVFATAFLLLTAMAGFAQKKAQKAPKPAAVKTFSTSGTVTSVEGDKLVLSRKVSGKEEQVTITMNDQTKKTGDLHTGGRATVHYKVENGENIATSVSAPAAQARRK